MHYKMNRKSINTAFVMYTLLIWPCVSVFCESINNEDLMCKNNVEGRKKSGQSDLLTKILPNLAMPFLVQSMILPLVLAFMKITMLKSFFIGKLGILLWIINILYNRSSPEGALHSHAVNINHRYPEDEGMYSKDNLYEIHDEYREGVEYGSYANRRRKRKK